MNGTDDPPAQKVTDEELLAAVGGAMETLGAPAVPTAEVATRLPITRQTVKRRLDDLADAGRVAALPAGQGRIWWLPDDGGVGDAATSDLLFGRVVVPIESPADAAATCRALRPYLADGVAEVVVLHVIEDAGGPTDAGGERDEATAEIFDIVTEAFEEIGITLFDTRVLYRSDVADAILEAAADVDASAIVFTPQGASRWLRLLTGDVALPLVTETDRPVVVLPEPDESAETS